MGKGVLQVHQILLERSITDMVITLPDTLSAQVLPQSDASILVQPPIKALPVPLGLVCFGRHHVIIIAAIAAGTSMSANTGTLMSANISANISTLMSANISANTSTLMSPNTGSISVDKLLVLVI